MASLLKTFRKLSKGEQDTFEIALNLSSAFEELHVGEVRLAEGYSLTDVMYSVQIMDPKMDTGLTMPRDPQKLDTADKLNQRSLTNEELIGLIDGFFTQSVRFSLYLFSRYLFADDVVRRCSLVVHIIFLFPCHLRILLRQ